MAATLAGLHPGFARMVDRNRRYLAGQVRAAAGQGITRFLDLGSGFPSAGSAAMAAAAGTGAQVTCVDWDPCVARYRAVLAAGGITNVSVVQADVRNPARVLAHPDVAEVTGPGQPVCAVFGLVLHMMSRAAAAHAIAGYAAACPPGSMVVVTVMRGDDAALFRSVREAWRCAGVQLVNYSLPGIEGLLTGAGLEVQPPGAGPVLLAEHGRPGKVIRRLYVAGATALKPGEPARSP
jgi:hypothetical protein